MAVYIIIILLELSNLPSKNISQERVRDDVIRCSDFRYNVFSSERTTRNLFRNSVRRNNVILTKLHNIKPYVVMYIIPIRYLCRGK